MAYLSFFGSVEEPTVPSPALMAVADDLRREHEEARYREEYPLRDGEEWVERKASPLPDGLVIEEVRHDTLIATYYVLDDQAVITVRAAYADWLDVAVSRWPIVFVGPAAIAGACCAPRYGI